MLKRLSGELCKNEDDCPSVWEDDQNPDDLIIVGHPVTRDTVRMADDEAAVRISRKIVADAKI